MGLKIFWLHGNRAVEGINRVFGVSLQKQDDAQIVMGFGEIQIDPGRLTVALNRFLQPPLADPFRRFYTKRHCVFAIVPGRVRIFPLVALIRVHGPAL